MLIDCGQAYTLTVENLTVPTSPASGAPFDLVQIATSAAVPILVRRVVVTANATAASIQRVQLLRKSAAGTGGTSCTAFATNGGSSATSTTCNYLVVTTTGGAGNAMDSQQWNEFAPYEFNQSPAGILVPVSGFISVSLVAAPGTTYSASFTVEFVELK
jgi:hypothetical protein